MIGDDRTTSSAPTSTGYAPSPRQTATAARALSGGSIDETKTPPSTTSIVCTAISERARASSRRPASPNEPPASQSVVFSTVTASRT